MFLKKLRKFFSTVASRFASVFYRKPPKRRPKISMLIPFSSTDPTRKRNFKWVVKYWKAQLPDAQIIIGHSDGEVFCKGEALNNAIAQATGKVIVIMDADAYIDARVIDRCADRILEEIDNHLWYVPYRHLYRLTDWITTLIVESSPDRPITLPSPPPDEFIEQTNRDKSKYGHRYGAMCMIFPRDAFDILGCFDERFTGWGGEDVALLRALDTLYGKHKTTKNDILHLWHPFLGDSYKTRIWEGQKTPSSNHKLASEYNRATRHPKKMRKLVDAGCEYRNNK